MTPKAELKKALRALLEQGPADFEDLNAIGLKYIPGPQAIRYREQHTARLRRYHRAHGRSPGPPRELTWEEKRYLGTRQIVHNVMWGWAKKNADGKYELKGEE